MSDTGADAVTRDAEPSGIELLLSDPEIVAWLGGDEHGRLEEPRP